MPRTRPGSGPTLRPLLPFFLSLLFFLLTLPCGVLRGQEPDSLASAPASGAPLREADPFSLAQERSSTLRAGDRVVISIFTAAGDPIREIEGPRIVDRSGQIYLPFVGDVAVAGMDDAQVREILEERFSDYFASPVVDVRIELRVNVTGAVRQPGNFFVDPMSTIVDALARAGGVSSEVAFQGSGVAADMERVRLVRGGSTRILDLRPDQATRQILALPVRSGDWLHVPPQPRSLLRDNIQLISAGLSVVATIVGVTVLIVD